MRELDTIVEQQSAESAALPCVGNNHREFGGFIVCVDMQVSGAEQALISVDLGLGNKANLSLVVNITLLDRHVVGGLFEHRTKSESYGVHRCIDDHAVPTRLILRPDGAESD